MFQNQQNKADKYLWQNGKKMIDGRVGIRKVFKICYLKFIQI